MIILTGALERADNVDAILVYITQFSVIHCHALVNVCITQKYRQLTAYIYCSVTFLTEPVNAMYA